MLSRWISAGLLDAQLGQLGTQMAARLADPRIQARAFARLILCWVIERGGFDGQWVEAFEQWYPAEADLRGYDSDLGWLHAVAHGADLLGLLGCDARVRPARMLELGARRMLAATDFVWRDQEDDRLAHAIALTMTRDDLTAGQSTGWLDLVDAKATVTEPGPVPPWASNTMRTLRMLYVLADRGVRAGPDGAARPLTHRAEVLARLARSVTAAAWFAG